MNPQQPTLLRRVAARTLYLFAVILASSEPTNAQDGHRSSARDRLCLWLEGTMQISLRNESNDSTAKTSLTPGASANRLHFESSGIELAESWSEREGRLAWRLEFSGGKERVGHEVQIEMPVLSGRSHVFTPGESGVMSLDFFPHYRPAPYAHLGWSTRRCFVLPLVSLFDVNTDTALTVALSPEQNIPHLQVEWTGARVLKMTLAHRALGGEKPSRLDLRFYAHKADYRSVLKAYSDEFPRYFRPAMPRGRYEGPFWYHHIQAHPPLDEMARQNMRFVWTSFWFTHLGEYLPPETEWEPYTYARWWKLQETMSDKKIRDFTRRMHAEGIGVFAYFNVTEYGGAGGKAGNTETASRLLREKYADALLKNEAGNPIPTWEGSLAMNAGRGRSLFPALVEQLRRHVNRLPDLDGFVIDRLDWASRLDYGHHDGETMVGSRAVENMVWPVREGVEEVCRQAHEAGQRVYVNQFWRVEVLRDVDGYCHECDYVRGLGYLAPFRPVSAWHQRQPYRGDLLEFEAQLKRRLQFACMPQMIAHEFPISQQHADPEAADLLEIWAPLFATLDGKRQVLLPHCVSVTGANDVNLFVNRNGHYVVPVTSRTRFLSRRSKGVEKVRVQVRVPDASDLTWARVISADGGPYRSDVGRHADAAEVILSRHATASVVVLGRGAPLSLPSRRQDRLARLREALFPPPAGSARRQAPRPSFERSTGAILRIAGVHVGEPGPVRVSFRGKRMGQLARDTGIFTVSMPERPEPQWHPSVQLETGDERTWFVVERLDLILKQSNDKLQRVAHWTPGCPVTAQRQGSCLEYPLDWLIPEELEPSTAVFQARDTKLGGRWKGNFGSGGAWIPKSTHDRKQNGFLLTSTGTEFVWAAEASDRRVLQSLDEAPSAPAATCWFASDDFLLTVAPPDSAPYLVTIYVVDYDRNGRALDVSLEDNLGQVLDSRRIPEEESAEGVYLTWKATGPIRLESRKSAGFNAVASGVFVDRVTQ